MWRRWLCAWLVVLGLLSAAGRGEETLFAKRAVPMGRELQDASKLLNEAYGKETAAATSPAAKRELALKLLGQAREERGAGLYVLLLRARDLAIEGGDLEGCEAAVALLAIEFDVDATKMTADAYVSMGRAALTPAERRRVVRKIGDAVQAALNQDRFDAAKVMADAGLGIARPSGDMELIRAATADVALVRVQETVYGDAKKALATLAANPTDADANLRAGKYRCFMKGDWKAGLPMLAQGSDPALKSLAEKEALGPGSPEAQVKLGDEWWDLGEKLDPAIKRELRKHASTWYTVALPQLSGLVRSKVEKRLKELEQAEGQALDRAELKGWYRIVSEGSGLSAGARDNSINQGSLCAQQSQGSPGTVWCFDRLPNDAVFIRNRNRELVMGVREGSRSAGADVILWTKNNSKELGDQNWIVERVSEKAVKFVNANSGMCLEIRDAGKKEGVGLTQGKWANKPNQRWILEQVKE